MYQILSGKCCRLLRSKPPNRTKKVIEAHKNGCIHCLKDHSPKNLCCGMLSLQGFLYITYSLNIYLNHSWNKLTKGERVSQPPRSNKITYNAKTNLSSQKSAVNYDTLWLSEVLDYCRPLSIFSFFHPGVNTEKIHDLFLFKCEEKQIQNCMFWLLLRRPSVIGPVSGI